MMRQLKKILKEKLQKVQYFNYKKENHSQPPKHQVGEIWIFLRSWNRPFYLWTCLDSIYKNTKANVKIVLIDNASTDPLVKTVIKGFERRGMFHAVHYMKRNHRSNQQLIFSKYKEKIGKYLFLLDADITIEKTEHCWIEIMIDIAERLPELGLLGSYLDISDFVDFEIAKVLEPDITSSQIGDLIKINSNERRTPSKHAEVINPFNPAGRLLLTRTSIINQTGLPIGGANLCKAVRTQGYQQGITTRVVHRHLSLLNIYDYPEYDFQQLNKYLTGK
jgi:hypothetical protein